MEFDLARLQPKERASFALRALYEAAGCRKYHMGRFEEYGLYQENRSFLSSEQVITFTDLDGRLLALKPDVTLSIAKTAQPAPGETLKYYYHENVYRPSAESHTFKEISQMGLELLGEVKEPEVRQTVFLAARSLEQMGQPWVLEISHMGGCQSGGPFGCRCQRPDGPALPQRGVCRGPAQGRGPLPQRPDGGRRGRA